VFVFVYFVIDSVQKLLDTPPYSEKGTVHYSGVEYLSRGTIHSSLPQILKAEDDR
jgi:hypothetical protein